MANSNPSIHTSRIFIAVKPELNAQIFESIYALKQSIPKSTINWVAKENFHLTLIFLGDIPNTSIANLKTIIDKSITSVNPFSITFRGFGYFGKPLPKVVWIGIDPCEQLSLIHKNLTRELLNQRFTPEQKEFSPHLTIGRVKELVEIRPFERFTLNNKNIELQRANIESVILFESILKPGGPEYKTISLHQLR